MRKEVISCHRHGKRTIENVRVVEGGIASGDTRCVGFAVTRWTSASSPQRFSDWSWPRPSDRPRPTTQRVSSRTPNSRTSLVTSPGLAVSVMPKIHDLVFSGLHLPRPLDIGAVKRFLARLASDRDAPRVVLEVRADE